MIAKYKSSTNHSVNVIIVDLAHIVITLIGSIMMNYYMPNVLFSVKGSVRNLKLLEKTA